MNVIENPSEKKDAIHVDVTHILTLPIFQRTQLSSELLDEYLNFG